jgi:hypothetical protein
LTKKSMRSITLTQLRQTRKLKAWLRDGETVELKERHQVIAKIVPEWQEQPVKWPDFEARAKKIFGDRVLPAVELLIKERGRY